MDDRELDSRLKIIEDSLLLILKELKIIEDSEDETPTKKFKKRPDQP